MMEDNAVSVLVEQIDTALLPMPMACSIVLLVCMLLFALSSRFWRRASSVRGGSGANDANDNSASGAIGVSDVHDAGDASGENANSVDGGDAGAGAGDVAVEGGGAGWKAVPLARCITGWFSGIDWRAVATVAWMIPHFVLLRIVHEAGAVGWIEADAASMIRFCAVCTACGAATCARYFLAGRHGKIAGLLGAAANALAIPVVIVLGFLMLEMPWNASLAEMPSLYEALEIGMIAAGVLLVYFVLQRSGIALALASVVLAGIGAAQYFVKLFKDAAILPADLLAMGTAMAVKDQYEYMVSSSLLDSMALLSVCLCISSFVIPARIAVVSRSRGELASRLPSLASRALNIVLAAASAGALIALTVVPDYASAFDVNVFYWHPIDSYKKQGFLPSFVNQVQNLAIEEPEGYSDSAAMADERRFASMYASSVSRDRKEREASYAEEKPIVIAIMNETFMDMSYFENMGLGYPGPQFFKKLDAAVRGKMAVSVHGGGTCNSEFEFLTGCSSASLGAGKYPYSMYNMEQVENSLPRLMSAQGYRTVAMHPNLPQNWNRSTRYKELGFDEFLSIEDFEDDRYHAGISDEATYDKILEVMDSTDEPQFIFAVTMQNHSAYDMHNIPDGDLVWYEPSSGVEKIDPYLLNEYISCIEESDRALKKLISALSKEERHVVVAFFGDHHPFMTADYNNIWYPEGSEDGMEHIERIYQTDYFIWENHPLSSSGDRFYIRDDSVPYEYDGEERPHRSSISEIIERMISAFGAVQGTVESDRGNEQSVQEPSYASGSAETGSQPAAEDPESAGFGYYDEDGEWHSYGYFDANGEWRVYGYFDDGGEWHSNGYYDEYGNWHMYEDELVAGYSGKIDDSSSNYLASMLLEAAGIPLTEYQQSQLYLRTKIPAVNLFGYKEANGRWHGFEERTMYSSYASSLLKIDYLNFGKTLR